MVHQHFALARQMTAVENIIVGLSSQGLGIGLKEASKKVQALCAEYGVTLDLHIPIRNLSVGQQQWIEIIKAMYLDVKLLILDEPTAVLTPQETENLLHVIAKMRANGLSVLLITHKLREVMDFTDRVTVLRHGRVVNTVVTAEVSREILIEMMVGHSLAVHKRLGPPCGGEPVLTLERLVAFGDDKREVVRGVDLQVRGGEIVGLAGVSGNGQAELFDVILGIRKAATGQVIINRREVTNKPTGLILKLGVACIPPDRMQQGLLMGFPIKQSLILGLQNSPPFRHGLTLNETEVRNFALRSLDEYQVVAESPEQITSTLSGGNLQRLILARELAHKPVLVIANSPTRGLDIAATQYVQERLLELRDSGVGVLLISEDLDEILSISDRVVVIYRGCIVGQLASSEASRSNIGLLMAGFEVTEPLENSTQDEHDPLLF